MCQLSSIGPFSGSIATPNAAVTDHSGRVTLHRKQKKSKSSAKPHKQNAKGLAKPLERGSIADI